MLLLHKRTKREGKHPQVVVAPLLSFVPTHGETKKKSTRHVKRSTSKEGTWRNLEKFGYSGTSDEVSIKYGRYGLLCFFLSTMYTRIHMNMMHDPNTPHFLICLQVSHAFGHQGLIRVTFASQRKKERKKESLNGLSSGCGPQVLCVMNEWQK